MSRSGYVDDCDGSELNLYRGRVARAINGKRGQAFLRELAVDMDAMAEKRLVEHELVTPDGEVCAMGVICKNRKIDVSHVDVYDSEKISKLVGIADSMVREIEYENDEGTYKDETPEQRWERMRKWVNTQISHA